MIKKEDWQRALAQCEAMKINDMVSKQLSDNAYDDKIKSFDKNIDFCKERIADFKEDPMPEEVKEVLEAAK